MMRGDKMQGSSPRDSFTVMVLSLTGHHRASTHKVSSTFNFVCQMNLIWSLLSGRRPQDVQGKMWNLALQSRCGCIFRSFTGTGTIQERGGNQCQA